MFDLVYFYEVTLTDIHCLLIFLYLLRMALLQFSGTASVCQDSLKQNIADIKNSLPTTIISIGEKLSKTLDFCILSEKKKKIKKIIILCLKCFLSSTVTDNNLFVLSMTAYELDTDSYFAPNTKGNQLMNTLWLFLNY